MRRQARRGNGRFTRNTMENTFGLHCEVCPVDTCRRLNPWTVGQAKPERCHACGSLLDGTAEAEPSEEVREAWEAENHARAREFGE